MINIVSYNGGKDSTAMLIKLIEENIPFDEVIYVDMGSWMWEGTNKHLKQVEKTLNINITCLNVEKQIQTDFIKYGFPSMFNRWCTGIKRETMKKYIKENYDDDITQYIGICADEKRRQGKQQYSAFKTRFPLVEMNITTNEAHNICKQYNFNFNDVYNHHSHYNCWCCPLQSINELRYIYTYDKPKWDKLRSMQNNTKRLLCKWKNNISTRTQILERKMGEII